MPNASAPAPTAAARRAAVRFVTQIDANVASFFVNDIDHATFHARQHALWDAVTAAGQAVINAVTATFAARL